MLQKLRLRILRKRYRCEEGALHQPSQRHRRGPQRHSHNPLNPARVLRRLDAVAQILYRQDQEDECETEHDAENDVEEGKEPRPPAWWVREVLARPGIAVRGGDCAEAHGANQKDHGEARAPGLVVGAVADDAGFGEAEGGFGAEAELGGVVRRGVPAVNVVVGLE